MTENEPPPIDSASFNPRPFDFNHLPLPVVRNIIEHLRFPELRYLQNAINSPTWNGYSQLAETICNREIKKYNSFAWTRHIDILDHERMAHRALQSVVYHEACGSLFVFGGKSMTAQNNTVLLDDDEHACFNDLWRVDLVTKKMSRVFVRASPYPLPKFAASMVLYKNELLLFGGRRPSPPGHGGFARVLTNPNIDEIHLFNVELGVWRKITTINEAPALAGHSAVMCDDLMVTFGGRLALNTLNSTLRVLNMKTLHWFIPRLPDVDETVTNNAVVNGRSNFPLFEVNSTSLIKLKPGHLLLLGELRPPGRENCAVVISYDVNNPEGCEWKWRRIPVSGKWWYEERGPHGEGSPRSKNSNYPQVVPLYTQSCVRLVTLGFPAFYFRRENTFMRCSPVMEARVARQAHFIENVIKNFRKKLEQFPGATKESDSIDYSSDGMQCRITNIFSSPCHNDIVSLPGMSAHKQELTLEVQFDKQCPVTEYELQLDEVDLGYMTHTLRNTISMWRDYYRGLYDVFANQPIRRRAIRPTAVEAEVWKQGYLVPFTAYIPLGEDWTPEELTEITYEEGDCHRHCPPPFVNFVLCAGRAEVVLHGGEKDFKTLPTVTYVMTPAARIPPNEREKLLPLKYRKILPMLPKA